MPNNNNNNNSMNFYATINDEFGEETREEYKKYAVQGRKLAAAIARKEYLFKCKKANIIPQHITHNFRCIYAMIDEPSPFRNAIQNDVRAFQRKLLNKEVRIAFWKIGKLKRERELSYGKIIASSSINYFERYFELQQIAFERNLQETLNRHERKLNARGRMEEKLKVPQEWLVNISNIELPTEVNTLLALGPKFSLPGKTTKKDVFELIADVENALVDVEKEEREETRGIICNILMNGIEKSKKVSETEKEILHLVETMKQFVNENEEKWKQLCVIPSDKGNVTVVTTRAKYKEGMSALVNDEKVYKRLKRDPTTTFEREINEEILNLHRRGLLTVHEKNRLTRYDSVCPRIYGLPKIHKIPWPPPRNPSLKFRPIVSCQKSPMYNISRYLSNIINKSIDQNNFNIRNSHKFRDFVTSQILPPDYILISLDVVSLFTCIPLSLVENAVEFKWIEIEKCTDLSKVDFKRLVGMTMKKSYFVFDGKFYQQIDGTAMGIPISPALADLVMTILLEAVTEDLGDDVLFVRKYVDDLCLAIRSDAATRVLQKFNNYNEAIQFTMELEEEGKLPFLDLLLVRQNDGRITTEFYEKKFASGRILNYRSSHPMHQKLNVAMNLIQRMFDFTSGPKPVTKAREKLVKNGFPRGIANRLVNRCIGARTKSRERNKFDDVLKSMLFVDGISQKIEKVLRKENDKFVFAARSRKRVRKFFTKVKDPVDPLSSSNVIYAVKCRTCYERKYIGQTKQKLNRRMNGHKSSLKRALDELQRKQKTEENVRLAAKGSALVYHSVMTNHEFSLEMPEILHSTNHPGKLNVLEMLHIQDQMTVNQRNDCANLSALYKSLLGKFKKK
jgi:hypothetical protein